MRRPRAPLFLQPSSYRRRRLRDAARLLPVAGALFLVLPILWDPAGTDARDTAVDGIYLFGVWAGLILVAALMAPGLTAPVPDDPDPDAGED